MNKEPEGQKNNRDVLYENINRTVYQGILPKWNSKGNLQPGAGVATGHTLEVWH